MFKSLVALSTLALAVAATPLKRSGGPWCDNFISGFDIAHGFSLVAVQSSGDAANAPTTPLTMGPGGAIDGAAFHTLSVSCPLQCTSGFTNSLIKRLDGCFVSIW